MRAAARPRRCSACRPRQPGGGHQLPGQLAALTSCTAACFSSGCLRLRAEGRVVSALTPPRCRAAQHFVAPVHGDEGLRRRHRVAGRTGSTSAPRRELHAAPGRRRLSRSRARSCGCSSMLGLGGWPNSRPSVPVRLMPCHWSRSRPVVSDSGKRASRSSASGLPGRRRRSARGRRRWRSGRRRTGARVPCVAPSGRATAAACCQRGVAQAGDVEVAAARALAVLVPDALGACRRGTASRRRCGARGSSASSRRATSTAMRQSSRASPGARHARRARG